MNPWHLSASDLLIWGVVLHLIADWPLQNDWIARRKVERRRLAIPTPSERMRHPSDDGSPWWDRHPAAWVHATIHGALLALVFGWVAVPLAIVHLVIDTRVPVAWWSRLVRQTQPQERYARGWVPGDPRSRPSVSVVLPRTVVDIGTEVRFWTDQTAHIACIAIAALAVTL